MKSKLVSLVCAAAVLLVQVPSTRAETAPEPLAVLSDIVVVRPACLVTTIVGSAFFLVSLPVAAISKSVKPTAEALVLKPARATFTRPVGDMDSLTE